MNLTSLKPSTKDAINQLTTIDASQLYDYNVLNTQQSNDGFQQNPLVIDERQSDSICYDNQQIYRDPVQPSQLQTGHNSTHVQFASQIFNNQADGCSNYQHSSYKSGRQGRV